MAEHVYRRTVDLDGKDSLAMIGRLIEPGSQVLELGLATGYFSQALAEKRGCTVDGVEVDAGMAEEAAPWVRTLVVADLESTRLAEHFPEQYYDVVVCADILEHLRNPETVVRQLAPLLREDGKVVVSIPNIAYSGTLLELYNGDFQYRPEGLLDRTHLRFYTLRSFTRLVEAEGLRVERVERVHARYEESEFRQHFGGRVPEGVLDGLLRREDADVYQYILALRPRPAMPELIPAEHRPTPPVDIVIPVYKGLEQTRRCIHSVLNQPQSHPSELVVIDDASPEPEIGAFLDQLRDEGRITLIRNPRNLGFTRSANIGLGLHPDRDVVLLNSDTEVYGDWLDRLHRAAYSEAKVGTVTPFSNNATICSYPRFCQANEVPKDWHPAKIDTLCAKVNAERYAEIPTAVGFCMYVTRAGLNHTGYLDVVSFGRGYGEENDLCMRLHWYGFKHLLCGDTYVFHQGGVSFGAGKPALEEAAQQEIARLHPHYAKLVDEHIASDPARPLRRRLDIARIEQSDKPRILFITHSWGGGTERHVQELAGLLADYFEVFILRSSDKHFALLDWAAPGEEFHLYFNIHKDFPVLTHMLEQLSITRIHFHHLIHHDTRIWELPKLLGVPFDFTIHDYYPICPQINLTTEDGSYCGEPDEEGCAACLAKRPTSNGMTIQAWRNRYEELLHRAERVFGPSLDVIQRIKKYFPEPHYVFLAHSQSSINDNIRVVVLGQLSEAKGAHQLQACAMDAKKRNLPLTFIVIGNVNIPIAEHPELPLFITGNYKDHELDDLIAYQRPDIIYFPARWPETFSYTLSHAMRTHQPIIAPRLGSFVERLQDYPRSMLVDWSTPANTINDKIIAIAHASCVPCYSSAVDHTETVAPQ